LSRATDSLYYGGGAAAVRSMSVIISVISSTPVPPRDLIIWSTTWYATLRHGQAKTLAHARPLVGGHFITVYPVPTPDFSGWLQLDIGLSQPMEVYISGTLLCRSNLELGRVGKGDSGGDSSIPGLEPGLVALNGREKKLDCWNHANRTNRVNHQNATL
jgi:hypothetical protein